MEDGEAAGVAVEVAVEAPEVEVGDAASATTPSEAGTWDFIDRGPDSASAQRGSPTSPWCLVSYTQSRSSQPPMTELVVPVVAASPYPLSEDESSPAPTTSADSAMLF